MEWPAYRAHKNEVAQRTTDDGIAVSAPSAQTDPVEVIEEAVQALNSEAETELRRRLQASSPEFFEKAVVELLWAMGYGGTHGQKRHVGKTGDGGIDGVIGQDALGLQKVYIQAKRYGDGNNAQAGEVRDFYGALRARGAEKGVFITTSKFSAGARDTAARFSGDIVLIDGIRLTALMLDYSVAVQEAHTFSLYEVDEDFFESALF